MINLVGTAEKSRGLFNYLAILLDGLRNVMEVSVKISVLLSEITWICRNERGLLVVHPEVKIEN
jgi:hypothetical protein